MNQHVSHIIATPDAVAVPPAPELPEMLRQLISVVPGIIYVFDHRTLSNVYANRSIADLLGYRPEEVQGFGPEVMARMFHPEDLDAMANYFASIRSAADGEVCQFEYRCIHRNGETVWLSSHDTVFERDAAGAVVSHCGCARDITASKRVKERLLHEKRTADIANEQLRTFAYSVSHDLKSPSNTVRMLLSEIRESSDAQLGPESAQFLDLAMQSVDRMLSTVTDLLDFTHVLEDAPVTASVDLAGLLRDVRDDLQAEIAEAGARIVLEDLPLVTGSPVQLRKLFQNLMSNAIKYRRRDVPLRIAVRAERDAERGRALLRVEDNGLGIPVESQEAVFVLFKRLHLHSEIGGTGLGLAICRQIAHNHGGEITLESEPGAGSTFTVSLPAC